MELVVAQSKVPEWDGADEVPGPTPRQTHEEDGVLSGGRAITSTCGEETASVTDTLGKREWLHTAP